MSVEFNVSVDYIVELVEKIIKYHKRIMNSIEVESELFIPKKVHEEYKENMEELMDMVDSKYEPIKEYLHANMYGELEEEKLIILKEIDTAIENKGIYKSNGITSPYNPMDMIKTVLPYETSETMKKIMAKATRTNTGVTKLK
jgi:hypothetical protein